MEKKIAMRVSLVSIIINLVLSLLKLLAGIVASSGAMISDAVHSASDVFSTFIVMIGVQISSKQSDADHQAAVMNPWPFREGLRLRRQFFPFL